MQGSEVMKQLPLLWFLFCFFKSFGFVLFFDLRFFVLLFKSLGFVLGFGLWFFVLFFRSLGLGLVFFLHLWGLFWVLVFVFLSCFF